MDPVPDPDLDVPEARIPDGPVLGQLAGVDEGRAWGEALADDLRLYRDGRLAWSQVDCGCVLYGPPGTGKTTLARAIAAAAQVPLIATSYAAWARGRYVSDIVGEMRRVFATAATNAPCILAIDEVDSLPSRERLEASEVGTQMIVNALLELLDGFHRRPGVVVIATCNDADRLDPALVRPGRLDRRILVPLPPLQALPQIIAFHLGDDIDQLGDLSSLATACLGMSGAAIEQLIRDGRRHARRHGRRFSRADLLAMLESKVSNLDRDAQWRIAIHEAGHAVAAFSLNTDAQITLSIIAKDNGGRTTCSQSNRPLTRELVEKTLVVLLAGRAAEDVMLGDVSAGAGGDAGSDLAQATGLALRALAKAGLSTTGTLLWQPQPDPSILSLYSQNIVAEVDDMLRTAYQAAKELIERNRTFASNVATALFDRRALSHQDFMEIARAVRAQPGTRLRANASRR